MADELLVSDVFNLDEEKLSVISESLKTFLPILLNDKPDSDALNFDELDHAIRKVDETPTPVAPQETDKCAASDGSGFAELDDAIIKDDEFQSLMTSLALQEIETSDVFSFDEQKLDRLAETLQTFLASIKDDESDNGECDNVENYYDECYDDECYYAELDPAINNDDESFLASLAPIDKFSLDDFNFDAIMKHIVRCSNHHKRTHDDTLSDIYDMVAIGLTRGDIRKDQLNETVRGGAEKIVRLAYWYKIPLRSAAGERIRLQSDTLTFVRALTCFPHLASLFLNKAVGFAKNGAKSVLASEELPDAMKHSGFPGLIPKGCDPYLMKAYLFAHTAYMVDLGKLINPGDKRSLKAMAASQLEYSKAGVEKLPYDDKFRVVNLRAAGLTDPDVFKKIVDVCNNLCNVVGEPELTFATAEKCHIKNNKIFFFEDDNKDVAADELTKISGDKLKVASIHASSTSTD